MHERGLQAETQRLAAEAALAAARAQRAILSAELARVRIAAPFAGVITARPVEIGSLVERGDVIAELADDATLLAVAQAPQQQVADIRLGQAVEVRLLDGQAVAGRVRYVGRVADEGTRSFRIEAEVRNPDGRLPGGLSADLVISAGEVEAHALSPSQLTLDDAGRLGVKSVDGSERVVFHPVDMVQSRADTVWVSGLPPELRLITEGQGLVAPGEVVAVLSRPDGADPREGQH
jgi:multidrug efflux system membrane fusion protein